MTSSTSLATLPLWLLGATTLALALLRAWPGAGAPVLLVFPPWVAAEQGLVGAFDEPDWRPLDPGRVGPFAILRVIPAEPAADIAALRRASGAWLALAAPGASGCAPSPITDRVPRP
jgi:hypothetical protein